MAAPAATSSTSLPMLIQIVHIHREEGDRETEMLKTEIDFGNDDCGSTGGCNSWGRVCDTCRSATCTIYCRDDSAFLCSGCDSRIHAANGVASRHERVFVCEACERAPAAFICKADAASLCTTCDADVHDANPLSRRHHRVPILPISGSVHCPRTSNELSQEMDEPIEEEDEVEAASWLLLNPVKNNIIVNNNQANEFLFGGEDDEYLNLVEFKSCGGNQFAEEQYNNQQQQHSNMANKNFGGDSVVPFQSEIKEKLHRHNQNFQQRHEYDASESGFDLNGFVNHSVPISSMDVGVVPETTPSDDVSDSHPRPPKGATDLFVGPPLQTPTQLSPVDREARVLRYREKKKTRKFEKTIRYASRKAYAETRPRIKGRFAKRTDADIEAEQKFSTPFMLETTRYDLVPSF